MMSSLQSVKVSLYSIWVILVLLRQEVVGEVGRPGHVASVEIG